MFDWHTITPRKAPIGARPRGGTCGPNHALPRGDVTAGYMSVDTERLHPVMETIAGRLTALCQPAPPAVPAARVVPIVEPNIIPFARAKKRAAPR